MTRNYSGMTYIEMGIEPDDRFERQARQQAAERGWTFEKLCGDMTLIQPLVDGPWDDDRFLVVPPGSRIAASFDERIVKAEGEGEWESGLGTRDSGLIGFMGVMGPISPIAPDSLHWFGGSRSRFPTPYSLLSR